MNTQDSEQIDLRIPRLQNFGIKYPHHLLNIVLTNNRPGHELSIVQSIDSYLREYRINRIRVDKAYRAKSSTADKAFEYEKFVAVDQSCFEQKQDLYIRAMHATALGRFQLVSFFEGPGFGLSQFIGSLKNINSFQIIHAGIPESIINDKLTDSKLRFLKQDDSSVFFTPFDHGKMLFDNKLPDDIIREPIITVCQLQLNNLIKIASAEGLLLPLMYLIDQKIGECIDEFSAPNNKVSAKGLLVDSYGWSDYVLLLRSSNIEATNSLIHTVSQLTIQDIRTTWDRLIDELYMSQDDQELNNNLRFSLKEQQIAFDRRIGRLIGFVGDQDSNKTAQQFEISNNARVFSTSRTLISLIWPGAHFALQKERIERNDTLNDSEKINAQQAQKIYESMQITGNAKSKILLTSNVGCENKICDVLQKCSKAVGNDNYYIPENQKEFVTGGYGFDQILLGSAFVNKLNDLPQNTIGLDYCSFKEFLPKAYYLQWELILKYKSNFDTEDPCRPNTLLPWVGGKPEKFYKPLIQDFSFDIAGLVSKKTDRYKTNSLDFYLELFIQNFFTEINHLQSSNNKKSEELLKEKSITRTVRKVFTQVINLWQREMLVPQQCGNMLELADAFITWLKLINYSLYKDENITTYDLEERIRFFTDPFIQALTHRTFFGFYMSENSNYVTEFQGGLYNMITCLDGLIKSILSLSTDNFTAAGISNINHEPVSTTEILNSVYQVEQNEIEKYKQYILLVNRFSAIHMVHPGNISCVCHEILHALVITNEFVEVMIQIENGEQFVESILNRQEGDDPQSLYKERINDILVEYMLGWLLFEDRPEYYSKMFLVQLALNIESYGHGKEDNDDILFEHISRCFIIDQLLKSTEVRVEYTTITNTFIPNLHNWWEENACYILDDLERKNEFEKIIAKILEGWEAKLFVDYLNIIIQGTNKFFDSNLTTSGKLRSTFLRLLRETRNIEKNDQIKMMLKSSEPINFLFYEPDEKNDPRPLRIRRTEVLMGFLSLIRCYYMVFFEMFETQPDRSLFVKFDGDYDFKNAADNKGFLLDRSGGILFCTNKHTAIKYLNIRESFIKSIWSMTETLKFSLIKELSNFSADT